MALQYISNTDTCPAFANDDVIICQDGGTALTQNVDQSGGPGLDGINRFLVRRDWLADIGSALNPIKFECSEDVTQKAFVENDGGRGVMYYDADGNANVCDLVRVVGLMDMVLQGAGTFTIAELMSAQTTIAASCIVPTIEVGGNARVLLQNTGSATRPTGIKIDQGRLITQRGVNGTLLGYGGIVEIDAGNEAITTLLAGGASIKLIECGLPGTIEWRRGVIDVTSLRRIIAPTNLDVWLPNIDPAAWQLFKSHPLVNLSSTVISEKGRGEP